MCHLPIAIEYEKLGDRRQGEPSVKVRDRFSDARQRQAARYNGTDPVLGSDRSTG